MLLPLTRSVTETRLSRTGPNAVRSTGISCHPATRSRGAVWYKFDPTYAVTLNDNGRLEAVGSIQRTKRS